MTARIKNSIDSIRGAFRFFFMNLFQMGSTRIQLIWLTFFCWMFGIIWFSTVLPIAREVSIIFYRQNGINGQPFNLDSPYADTILTMLGTAFMGNVIAYVSSNWTKYKESPNNRPGGSPEEFKKEPRHVDAEPEP